MSKIVEEKRSTRTVLIRAVLALLMVGVLLPACSDQAGTAHAQAATTEKMADNGAVARVNGEAVSMEELEEFAAPQLKQIEDQRQKILEGSLSALVEQKLLEAEAKSRQMELDALVAAEVDGKFQPVTDAEVDAWYEQNKAQVRAPKEQVADRIKQFLEQQRRTDARNDFIKGLRDKYEVKVLLEPNRADVQVADAPTKGPDTAPVTIVEFSDFECPFCSRVNPTLDRVMKEYGDKVQVAFRQFPLAIHSNAQKAAEASLCAHEQGKFWEMHDAMFADQQKLAVSSLKETAAGLEMNADSFNQCLDSGKFADQVKEDMAAGQAAGVSGTPAMFVNGRLISGAVPYEQIAQVIDDELSRNSGE